MLDSPVSTASDSPAAPPARPRRRWLWWWLGTLALLLVLALVALQQLDPWLRRTLERQVAEKSGGRYELRIGSLRTDLGRRSITLRRLWLRPAGWPKARPDSAKGPAPWALVTVDEIRAAGIGLGALLRGEVVSVDTLLVRTVRARVLRTPERPGAGGKPLHEQLPRRIPGIRLAHLLVNDVRVVSAGRGRGERTQLRHGHLAAQDVLISRGAAQDSSRLSYAAAVEMKIDGLEAQVPGHHLSLGAARFSSRGRQLRLDSLRVMPIDDRQLPGGAARITLWLPRLVLAGLRPPLLSRRILQADTLRLSAPTLRFAVPSQTPPPLHEALAPYLRRVLLGRLEVQRAQLRLTRLALDPRLSDISLSGRDIRVDAAAFRDPQRVLYARDWQGGSGIGEVTIDAPYYRVRWAALRLGTQARTLRITRGLISPVMSQGELSRRKGHQATHLTLRLPEVRVTGLDYWGLLHKAVRAQTVAAPHMRLNIIGNAHYPLGNALAKVSPENVRRLPFRLDVRRLQVEDLAIRFKFTGELAKRPGYFAITRLTGAATNLTNDPRRMSAATPAVIRATAYLQDRCRFSAVARMSLLDPQGRHQVEGTFGSAPFAILNTITVPTRSARFERGQLHGIRVQLQVNRQRVTGRMWARYSDLKVDMLSTSGGGRDKQTFGTKVLSKAANVLIIRDDNPRRRGAELKDAPVRSDRDLRYSVFTIWMQGVVSGLLHSIGVPGKLAEELSEL
ncbi:hypothetical protein EJV47_17835 [Hymenobacter gummosus]|uniref:DUF748 domain-containing protein n=1 Tax=Hymenobacter gummosus TaxID=1776032 RepID=A0A3S0H4N9_9BACT|nr:hypothetical protein [Hymenobacter gummosus]RTQ47782.1 hypothetical protein EJV47_17835 [Hymenobacter gummosus]